MNLNLKPIAATLAIAAASMAFAGESNAHENHDQKKSYEHHKTEFKKHRKSNRRHGNYHRVNYRSASPVVVVPGFAYQPVVVQPSHHSFHWYFR